MLFAAKSGCLRRMIPSSRSITNREKSRCRSIGAHAGYRDVVLRASRVKVKAGNVDALRALDLLTALDLQALTDADRVRLSAFLSRVPAGSLLHSARYFPAKTSKKPPKPRLWVFWVKASGSRLGCWGKPWLAFAGLVEMPRYEPCRGFRGRAVRGSGGKTASEDLRVAHIAELVGLGPARGERLALPDLDRMDAADAVLACDRIARR